MTVLTCRDGETTTVGPMTTCCIATCSNPRAVGRRGWCNAHYLRWRDTGTPYRPGLAEIVWSRIERSGTCWNWTGVVNRSGYGRYGDHQAHRVVYRLLVDEIPPGFELDHLCWNKRCVNPAHLEPVTGAENSRRASWFERFGTCRNGHPISDANTYVRPSGTRECRVCRRSTAGERQRKQRRAKREQAL